MIHQVEPAEAALRMAAHPPAHLLDVREPEEHATASIPGARLIPLGELGARIGELADWRQDEILVVCHHGVRSLHAIHQLQAAGFPRLANVRGGIDAWSRTTDPSIPRY